MTTATLARPSVTPRVQQLVEHVKLSFGKGNAKLGSNVWSFSLPAGHTCPYAKDCRSAAVLIDGRRRIVDGPGILFRCFAAISEAMHTSVFNSRRANAKLLAVAAQSVKEAADNICEYLPKRAKIVRIHVSGDFATQNYFDSWLEVARRHPDVIFYAYTKALPFWVRRLEQIPDNMVLTASYGGHRDALIAEHNLRYAKVVFTEAEAAEANLPIDSDDTHAYDPKQRDKSFALLIHGTQPAGSEASRAVQLLDGKGSYPSKKR